MKSISQRALRRFAFAVAAALSLPQATANAGPTPPAVPAPVNFALTANPASCASAPLSTTRNPTTGIASTVAQCQTLLGTGQDLLATWTWNAWTCGNGNCSAYRFTLSPGTATAWLTYNATATNFAGLVAVSSLGGSCSSLQADWYQSSTASLVASASSNQACVQLPTPSPTPRPVHTPPFKCVAPGEPNPDHAPQCM